MARTAKVYMVGAGPGDPELLTRKALRLLEQADAIIYDRLVSAEILALANRNAAFIYAGRRRGQQEEVQSEIFDWFLRLSGSARIIVRLKSGDPMVFGRGGEELAFLAAHGIDAEIVPGISSALAAPGLAVIRVTHRDVTAHTSIEQGRPVTFIENASTDRERVVESTLGTVARGKVAVEAPAVIVISEVVRHRTRVDRDLFEGVAA